MRSCAQRRPRLKEGPRTVFVVFASWFAACAFAADVSTYQTGMGDAASNNVAGSPAASCAAAFANHREYFTRLSAKPEWQGLCWAMHLIGTQGNTCKWAQFESFGIPPESCPPRSGGWPDNPFYHVIIGITSRSIERMTLATRPKASAAAQKATTSRSSGRLKRLTIWMGSAAESGKLKSAYSRSSVGLRIAVFNREVGALTSDCYDL